jgi:uncharacterized protein (TIGR00725 family)
MTTENYGHFIPLCCTREDDPCVTFHRRKSAVQIGVIGSWEENLDEGIYDLAEEVGKLVAKRGGTLFTGGSKGVMEAAMKGARGENGLTVGIISTEKRQEYAFLSQFAVVLIMTGMGEYGRSIPLIHSVDGVIAIAGGAGTLMEIAMAYHEHKPVECIPVAGYTPERIRNLLDDLYLDHRRVRQLHFAETAREAVDLSCAHAWIAGNGAYSSNKASSYAHPNDARRDRIPADRSLS